MKTLATGMASRPKAGQRGESSVSRVSLLPAGGRERREDIGAIAAKLLHDLGNPLAGLSMQAQLLLRRADRLSATGDSPLAEAAVRVLAETSRLNARIRDLQRFSLLNGLRPRPLDLTAFVQDCVRRWLPLVTQRNLELEWEVEPGVPSILADRRRLARVLDILIQNAIEAADQPTGLIRIHGDRGERGFVWLSVEDDGPGLPPTVEAFQLFETTKQEGTGLGLAIARHLVELHGGRIGYEARPGRGVIFRVELPIEGPGALADVRCEAAEG